MPGIRTSRLLSSIASLATAALAAAACEPPPTTTLDPGPPAPRVTCTGGVAVRRLVGWPGGGVQLVVDRVPDGPLSWQGADGRVAPVASAPVDAPAGLTLVAVVPSPDAEVSAARRAAAAELIEAQPPGERIGLVELGAPARLLADLGEDRAHLRARLAAAAPAPAGPLDLGPWQAALAAVEGPYGALHRRLIVVGAAAPAPAPAAGAPGGSPEAVTYAPVDTRWWADGSTTGSLVTELAAARAATVRLGFCGGLAADAPLVVQLGTEACTLRAPAPLPDQAGVACDAAAAATDAYPYATTLDLTFTAAERQVYDDFSATDRQDDFRGSVALGGAPIPAKLHFRGQTSVGCERKSLAIDLDGKTPRRLAPGAADDDFLLISLCKDDGYFRQAFAERLLAEAGAFPLDRRFVRLRVDGEDRGVFWLLEQPTRTLVLDALAPRAVVRRRFDPQQHAPEVKFPDDAAGIEEALARYRQLGQLALEGAADGLDARLDERLDLDTYLRWLAIASLLENGDHVDEVFFYALGEADGWYFRGLGWDPDDLGTPCHHDGMWALRDRCELLYCAEADLDHAILRSEAVYARYRAVLAGLLAAWPAPRLAAELAQVERQLFGVLASDATAAAMTELGETTAAAAHTAVRARMDTLLAHVEARRGVLAARLDACETAP